MKKSIELLSALILVAAIAGTSFPALAAEASPIITPSATQLTPAEHRSPTATYTIPVTAYNSLPNQTDDTPYTTAMQTPTRHGVLAANFLPLGTRVKIPELYGDEIFVVEDRMNPRYDKKMDIWMDDLSDARQFGLRYVTIEVYRGK